MTPAPTHVTDAELEVLRALWERGPATIRELTELTYPDAGAAHIGTVQKLLERLESKRFVRRLAGTRPRRFAALVDRDALVALRLEETAARLCEGSFTPLVAQLVDARRLGDEDIRALRALVDRLESRTADRGTDGA